MHTTATTPLKSTGSPVIDFAAHAGRQTTGRQSAVQKLCAQYEATLAEFKSRHDAYSKAENAAIDAERAAVPAAIRPTKRNLLNLGQYAARDAGNRRPMLSSEIRAAIENLHNNTTKDEKSDGVHVITISDAGFPLTKKQTARLQRLEAKLPVAIAYEARCEAVYKRFRVEELNNAAQAPSAKLGPLAERIGALPSQDRADMLAKARIVELDPDMAEVSEDIGQSLARDFIRLAAAGSI